MVAASVYGRRRVGEDRDGLGAQRYADGDRCCADQHGPSDIDVGGGAADRARCAGAIVYVAGVFSRDREARTEERKTPAYCLTNSIRRFLARPSSVELSETGCVCVGFIDRSGCAG